MRVVGLVVGTLIAATGSTANAQGISARFGDMVATIGQDVVARVEVDDPLRVTKRVFVEIRGPKDTKWKRMPAERQGGWWIATFTSTTVWNAGGIRVDQPEQLEARAILYGARGGVLLVIGEIDPLTVDVLSPAETEARDRAFQAFAGTEEAPSEFALTGYVGTEGRAGSGARARAFIGVGGALATNFELLFYVGVGPAFSRPEVVADGGPIVLGFDAALRWFARSPYRHVWSAFFEPLVTLDARLPGVDPGAGARAGVLFPMSDEIAVEVSLGGAVMWFDLDDIGASGMLRAAVRFGGASDDEDET